MNETTIKKKVINSFMAGIIGSAISDPNHQVSNGMRYQCLILRAMLKLGKLPDPEYMGAFLLRKMNEVDLSLEASLEISQGMSKESIFPLEKPWDTPFGWAFGFWPDEIKLGGRLASAAVATAMQPRSTLQKVITASLDACNRHGIEAEILRERLNAAVKLATSCTSVQEFKRLFYEKYQIPTPNSLVEVIPLAFACVILGNGNPYLSIQAVIELERNSDQTACLAGQIAGALSDNGDLPAELVDQIIQENPELNIREISDPLGDFAVEQFRLAKSTTKSVLELSEKQRPQSHITNDSANLLFDKIFGFFIGGSCGDAMGCPVEWMHYEDICSQWGWVDRFLDFIPQKHNHHRFYEGPALFGPNAGYDITKINTLGAWDLSAGTYSDDMRFRLLLCSAMLDKENAINGSEFADYLIRYRMQAALGQSQGIPTWKGPELEWAEQLSSKVMLEALYGKRDPVGFCVTWDGPVGLIYPANEQLASNHGYLMAACVAHAFLPGATVNSLVECACANSYLYGELSQELINRIQGAVELARESKSVYRFYREFYDRFLVPQPSWQIYILEQIPATLALLTFGANDPKHAILAAVNFGRDTDTIACMVGELAGTLFGASALPTDWITTIMVANPKPNLAEIAIRFRDLALKRARLLDKYNSI